MCWRGYADWMARKSGYMCMWKYRRNPTPNCRSGCSSTITACSTAAPIASLIVLADTRSHWRPAEYSHALFGCRLCLEFPVAKLTDHGNRLEELLEDPNPFALVTAAHLLTQRTKGDDLARYEAKRRLVRLLYERGWEKQRVRDLFFVLDWLMHIPEALNERLNVEIDAWEEELKVRYISSIERIAMAKGEAIGEARGVAIGEACGEARGKAQALERFLVHRFGTLPESARKRLWRGSSEQLDQWFDRALIAAELKEVFEGAAS